MKYYSRSEQEETQEETQFEGQLKSQPQHPTSLEILESRAEVCSALWECDQTNQCSDWRRWLFSAPYWVWICCTMTICSIVELEPEECLQYSSTVPVQFQCLDTAGFFVLWWMLDVHPKKHTQVNQLKKRCIVMFPLP